MGSGGIPARRMVLPHLIRSVSVCVCVCVSVSLQQHFSQASSGSNNLPHSRPVRIFFSPPLFFFTLRGLEVG